MFGKGFVRLSQDVISLLDFGSVPRFIHFGSYSTFRVERGNVKRNQCFHLIVHSLYFRS